MAERIAIIGDGGWGTGLGIYLDKKGYRITIWGRFADYIRSMNISRENIKFLPGVRIPESIRLISGCSEELCGFGYYIVAVPVQYIRDVFSELKGCLKEESIFLSVSKGVEISTLSRPSQIISEFFKMAKVAVLSGPTHAEEIARGLPAAAVIASYEEELAKRFQKILSSESFRIYTSSDMIGVELGGALKNVIAIACGICEGLGLGDNAKAALLTRGIAEIARLGKKMGAREETFFGLSGVGDLVTTCYSPYGRNVAVGKKIAQGISLREVLDGAEQIAEGIWTTKSALRLAEKYGVDMPICREVYNVLFDYKPPMVALKDLMLRPLGEENRSL
jgi:glycerol-3-phosphate dehydrogenase (NAD(P)+)